MTTFNDLRLDATKRLIAAIPQSVLREAYHRAQSKIKAGRETSCGAGVLFFAADTGRFLWLRRSDRGDCAGTWCTTGGGVEPNETIDQAVKRETVEEADFDGDYDLIHMHRDVQPDGFTFHNHMAIVPTEFEPTLNDEHTAFQWSDEMPEPGHPRLAHAIGEWIKRQSQQPQG